jgi:hypothetical protein
MEMMTCKYRYDMGNLKRWHGENTHSYRLFMRKRHVVVDFDLYMRKKKLASVILFRHTYLAKVSYPVNVDDVSTIDDRQFVTVNISLFHPSEFVDVKNVSGIDDRLFVRVVCIYDLYLISHR